MMVGEGAEKLACEDPPLQMVITIIIATIVLFTNQRRQEGLT